MPIVSVQTSRSGIGCSSGTNTRASGRYAVALGYGTNVSGSGSFGVGGNSVTVSGTNAIGVGNSVTVSGTNAIGVGSSATSSGTSSVALGQNLSATGGYCLALGNGSAATADYSVAFGYYPAASRHGQFSHSAGVFALGGDAQSSRFVLRKSTTDATPTELALNGSTAYLTIPNNRVMACMIRLVATRTDVVGTTAAWPSIACGIARDATVGTTRILGSVTGATTTTMCDAGAATWSVAVTADATNGRLAITVTGEAAKAIRWVATVDMAEVASA